MAARTGAGTGVIVSLVVFVLTTVFLLVLTIVFYAGKMEVAEQLSSKEKALAKFVTSAEQNSEWVKAAESSAGSGRSVARFQQDQIQKLLGLLSGDPDANVAAVEENLKSYEVGAQRSAVAVMSDMRNQVRATAGEVDRLKTQLAERDADLTGAFDQLRKQSEAHETELKTATASIEEYRTKSQALFDEVQSLKDLLHQDVDKIKSRYDAQIAGLNSDLDSALQENAVFRARIKDFEQRMDEIRMRAQDPSLLVDGRVIDSSGASDVYVDVGRDKRVVLGMTFEVYDDEKALRPDKETGIMPRGKATLQVVKPAQTTSLCKVIRSVPARPIVKGDVIANAIFDPNYKFKFLIHGIYDVDGDGKATEAEADYLRSLVKEWGGIAVEGDELPGDLDFLVLGAEPPLPPPLRPNSTELEQRVFIDRKAAREKYMQLRDHATQAQIPVLNANRFLILIGHVVR